MFLRRAGWLWIRHASGCQGVQSISRQNPRAQTQLAAQPCGRSAALLPSFTSFLLQSVYMHDRGDTCYFLLEPLHSFFVVHDTMNDCCCVVLPDCGAGIGRVAKNFLLPRSAHVDLVEQSPRLLNASASYIGSDSARTTCICSNLQVRNA